MTNKPGLSAAAIHEAGHAVVLLFHGHPVRGAKIDSNEGGQVTTYRRHGPLPPCHALDLAVAGITAEGIHHREATNHFSRIFLLAPDGYLAACNRMLGASQDMAQAVQAATTVVAIESPALPPTQNDVGRVLKDAEDRVVAILTGHWAGLLRLANLLQERKGRVIKGSAVSTVVGL